ncbi:MAG: helix-turn-helix domain-containing protein [Thermomicrobiales bacterium]
MQTLVEDYLTVTEAAEQLHVAPSTIRRWIREGDLPAYRIGKRRVGVRKVDLGTMINPADANREREHLAGTPEQTGERKLTPEEKRRGLKAMDRAERLSKKILAERGGKIFTPESWVLINEARDERSRELAERS